ncbi:HNH endonuclease domain-containing protein [Tenacibaculum finnmarkense]|nr:HNH endonuclease domain-containing protein [Tenacibaculum finnmarkense]
MNLIPINTIFKNTTSSYKYYWWLSIIEISFLEDKENISYNEIIFKIISKMWYPVNYFKLSFGKRDRCAFFIKEIQREYSLEDNLSERDLYQFLIENKDSKFLTKITSELTRYVPFRFIRAWYAEQTRGLKDGIINSKIVELQDDKSPYTINIELKEIKINKDWVSWIRTNYNLIKSYTYFELIKYLERENPQVSNLSKKIEKPILRKLSTPTTYWKKYIVENPNKLDVFENKPLISMKELSIDHFLPWSFFTHDLIWNLHPTSKNINSSKNNYLPRRKIFKTFLFFAI